MLRRKEMADLQERAQTADKRARLVDMKNQVQEQMIQREKLREDAYAEYSKERQQVDNVVNKMIEEDLEMRRLQKIKQEQSKQDMLISQKEKQALLQRQRELEEYEEELVRRYASQQQDRANEL